MTEIVKGGSLGQGTAIPGSFDLDLVLYSRGTAHHSYRQKHTCKACPTKSTHQHNIFAVSPGIRADDVLHRGIRSILEMLNAFLSRHFGRRYTPLGLTDHAVRFSLTSENREGSIDVDLLPSPYWMYAIELHCFLTGLSSDTQRRK